MYSKPVRRAFWNCVRGKIKTWQWISRNCKESLCIDDVFSAHLHTITDCFAVSLQICRGIREFQGVREVCATYTARASVIPRQCNIHGLAQDRTSQVCIPSDAFLNYSVLFKHRKSMSTLSKSFAGVDSFWSPFFVLTGNFTKQNSRITVFASNPSITVNIRADDPLDITACT